jgi:hypothetical protein
VAHNPRVRADLTAWTAAIPLEPSELDALDEGQFAAINGDDGGTWAPADPIIIGGAGIEFTGAVPTGEDLNVEGDITIASGGTLTVESGGNVNVESDVHIHVDGELHIDNGGRIIVNSGGQINELTGAEHTHSSGSTETHASGSTDTYESGSTLALDGTVNVGATAVVTEAANATVAEGGTYTQTGPRSLRGEGRIAQRVIIGLDEDNVGYDGRSADVVVLPASVLHADRTYRLLIAGSDGQRIKFVNLSSTYGIGFASASYIYYPTDYNTAFMLRTASGYVPWVEFMYSAGGAGQPPAGWYVIGYHIMA